MQTQEIVQPAAGDGLAPAERPLSRRMLCHRLIAGSAVTFALAEAWGRPKPAQAAEAPATMIHDVAVLGETFQFIPAPGARPDQLSGSTFLFEGAIYPEGTIPGEGFDPSSVAATGRWICRGWFIQTPQRPQPAVITTVEHIFGLMENGRLFPPDQITTSGLEQAPPLPGFDPTQTGVGGTGKYAGARGTVRQYFLGHNTTVIGPHGVMGHGFNLRFEFQLAVPQ
jgi:hypothetical protein